MPHISIKNVEIDFPVYQGGIDQSLRAKIASFVSGGRINPSDDKIAIIKALKGINLSAHDGDRIGLIGRNGAGKTTLLKTIGAMYTPTAGNISISGQCTTLLSNDGAIDIERTGYENIHYMGMLLGFSRKQIKAMIPDIEEFTELGDRLSYPVKTYSAGMRVRLSFAIITAIQSDILLLDEIIGAGDAHFIEKANARSQNMYNKAKILFLASHSEEVIKTICNRVVYMKDGQIIFDGNADEAFELYKKNG